MNYKIFSLPIKSEISSTLSQRQIDQLPVIVVDHPQVRSAVMLQGAHLLHWQPLGETPVLWLSGNTPFAQGVAIRGGVPICFPWFGPFAEPNHGFARLLPWEFTAHREDAEGVELTFTLRDTPETLASWPHAFTLTARYKLGKTCTIELEAQGEYSITSALHTYFQIGDIDHIRVSGLGDTFIDKVNQGKLTTQGGDLTFTESTDRIYTHPQAVSSIVDPTLKRTIEVHHTHHSDVVAWNPAAELSKTIADMPDDGYKTFVCVETARVTQPFVATPTAPARLTTVISVKR